MAKKQSEKKAAANPKVKAEVKAEVKKEVKLISNQIYSFKANKKAKHLLDGKVYEISGEIAQALIAKGWGELID
tara:strand:+ start:424 stop:645 length:222 start_codon:yes stop_codon:yes gene_type:complete